MSVITTLPFSKKSPPAAGNKANARGIECQCDGSWPVMRSGLVALGSKMSSVVDLIECLASSMESEKVELRELVLRSFEASRASEKVDALPNVR